jgi:hypothetical protein
VGGTLCVPSLAGEKKNKPGTKDEAGAEGPGDAKGKRKTGEMMEHHPVFGAIEKHEAELKLSADQKTKLAELRSKCRESMADVLGSKPAKDLRERMREARTSGDEAKIAELRREFFTLLDKTEGGPGNTLLALRDILTQEQLKLLGEYREAEGRPSLREGGMAAQLGGGGGHAPHGPGKDSPASKPNTDKGAPKLYDDQK